MNRRFSLSLFSALIVLTCAAFAQDQRTPEPRFVVLPPHANNNANAPAGTLATWNGALQGSNFPFIMVGSDPSKTNTTTTVTVYIIPVNICVTVSGTKTCFDPKTKQSNGATAITNVVNSPIFQKQDYTIDGTDIGDTQYEDAFQRSNFWSDVMTNTNYHVLLKPVVLAEVTVNVPAADGTTGTNYFGVPEVALVDINYVDAQINAGLPKLKEVNPTNIPVIMTYNTYLTDGSFANCCIGGYHSATGQQTYAQFTYTVPTSGTSFSMDVSALSHELGEWMDDPLTNGGNDSPCGILEVGDPIEGEAIPHQYGTYTYTLNGYTYHLQDLATMKYFGQSPVTVNNNNWTFQGQNGTLPGLGTIGECSFGS
jgi:hypothetical protein